MPERFRRYLPVMPGKVHFKYFCRWRLDGSEGDTSDSLLARAARDQMHRPLNLSHGGTGATVQPKEHL